MLEQRRIRVSAPFKEIIVYTDESHERMVKEFVKGLKKLNHDNEDVSSLTLIIRVVEGKKQINVTTVGGSWSKEKGKFTEMFVEKCDVKEHDFSKRTLSYRINHTDDVSINPFERELGKAFIEHDRVNVTKI